MDATANDQGRQPEILREVVERAEVNIVCSTGYYYEGEGGCFYWKFRSSLGNDIVEELYELFCTEITKVW